jgi:uncharacterized membrane protein
MKKPTATAKTAKAKTAAKTVKATRKVKAIGNRFAPARFLLFVVVLLGAGAIGIKNFGWPLGVMIGFDFAATAFLVSCVSMLWKTNPADIRIHAAANDANRGLLLAVTAIVMLVVLVTVGAELSGNTKSNPASAALIIGTLALAWLFSNAVYALHYAHIHYSQDKGRDCGGVEFPDTKEPDYSDFVYFAFTLGMTFQTSDVAITSPRIRSVVTVHCLAAFVYNLGVLAFTINVLGS